MKFTKIFITILILVLAIRSGAQPAVGNWSNVGPIQFPVNMTGQVDGMGRVSQLKFHPTNPSKIYAVSASGGLFISTNGGNTWVPTPGTEQLPTTACSAVCIDYTNDNILYLSTGDQNYYGDDFGIWKSTNGGVTWAASNTNIGNRMAIDIIMDPTDHNKLIAATDDGVWLTTNAGATWTETIIGGTFRSLKQRPGSAHVLYAATGSLFYISNDMGATWTNITSGVVVPASNEGIRIAVTPADTNIVFLGTTDGYGQILRSTDGGLNFTNIYSSATQCIVCYDSTVTSGSQGYYNFNLTVNPTNANELLLGSHCVWRSTDGGYTWSWRTQWWDQVHTDMHDIQFNPYNTSQRFNANDGGVWLSTDPLATNWIPFSTGLAATEIYHAAQDPKRRQMISIGTQDNGELYYDGTWRCNRGGDWSAKNTFDNTGTATVYYADQGNKRTLSPLGGDVSYNSPFVPSGQAQLEFVPSLPNVVFTGKDTLWRSTNINSSSPTWTRLYVPGGNNIMSIASCKADSNILYFVTDNNRIYRSDNALAASPTFTMYTTPAGTNTMASIATDKFNLAVVILSCNNKIYRSVNKGTTWTNITGSLPALNILKVITDDYSAKERTFISCGNYVYYKDTTTAWTATTGLASVAGVTDLMIYNDGTAASVLRVSTYGRGSWEANIQNNAPPVGDLSANKRTLCPGDTVVFSKNIYGNYTSFSWSFPGGTPSSSIADSPIVVYATPGTYNATLTIYGPAGNDTVINLAYILVSNGTGSSITEGFEGAAFPPAQWAQMSASGIMWQQTSTAGGYGLSTHSILFDNFDNDGGGRHDRMITPKIDLTNADTAYVTFDVAYAFYPGYRDSLMVELSHDCGRTFTPIYVKDSSILATAPDATTSFVPDPTQWRTDTISLTSYLGSRELELAFSNIGHYGQNIYIDNVNIHISSPLSVKNELNNGAIQVYPNPTSSSLTITSSGKITTLSITNILGQTVYSTTHNADKVQVNVAGLPPGIYFLKINGSQVQRFVKE